MITLATVTGTINHNTSASTEPEPWVGAWVIAYPLRLDETTGLANSEDQIVAYSDKDGLVTMHLWPGAYRIKVQDGEVIDGADHTGVVVEAGGVYTLEALRGYVPGPGVSVSVMALPTPTAAGQALALDDDLQPQWQPLWDIAGAVESVNGKTGAVVLDAADVGADSAGTAAAAVAAHAAAVDPHPTYTTAAEAAAAAPVQSVAGRTGAVTLGVADVSGAVPSTDPRLTDARTPLAHAASHAAGQPDAITPASIGAQPAGSYASALGADDNYVTDAEKVKLSNLSGTNTGDQDLSGYLTTTAAPELIRDTMGTALVAGTNITITPNDAGDTITIAAAGGGSGSLDVGAMFGPCPVGKYLPYFAAGITNQGLNIASSTGTSRLYMRVCPVFAKEAYTYDRVSFGLATPATDVGSLIRIGLYTAAGAFVKELGTVDATSAASTKEIVINETLAAGVHLLAMRFESPTAAGTNPFFYGYSGAMMGEIVNSTPGEPGAQYKYLSNSSSPLTAWPAQHPNIYNAPVSATAPAPQISLRRAS